MCLLSSAEPLAWIVAVLPPDLQTGTHAAGLAEVKGIDVLELPFHYW
jgi:hypothetical protein